MSDNAQMTITEFLEARIAEDEAVARAASGSTVEGQVGAWSPVPGGDEWAVCDGDFDVEVLVALRPDLPRPPQPLDGLWGAVAGWEDLGRTDDREDVIQTAQHIARHDPARVLAECAAKRAIIEQNQSYVEAAAEREGIAFVGARCGQEVTGDVLKLFAAVYAGHEDYRQEWAL